MKILMEMEIFPFVISESMELLAGDTNDLESLNDRVVTLIISLSDGNGKEGLITGTYQRNCCGSRSTNY